MCAVISPVAALLLTLVATAVSASPAAAQERVNATDTEIHREDSVFEAGETVGGAWTFERAVHHREFRRYFFSDSAGDAVGVEVTFETDGGTWRVQPAPDSVFEPELAEAVRVALEAVPEQVVRAEQEAAPRDAHGALDGPTPLTRFARDGLFRWLRVANGLWAALALLLLIAPAVRSRRHRETLLLVALGITIGALAPRAWLQSHLTVLHEGNTAWRLDSALGYPHAEINFLVYRAFAIDRFGDEYTIALLALARTNAIAIGALVGGLLAFARRSSGLGVPLLAGFAVLLVGTNPWVLTVITTELPSALLGIYGASLVLAASFAFDPDGAPLWQRMSAAALAAVAAALMAATRVEYVIVAGPAAVAIGLTALGIDRPLGLVRSIGERVVSLAVRWPALFVVVALVGIVTLDLGFVPNMLRDRGAWLAAGADPLRPKLLVLPELLLHWLSPTLAVLVLAGWWRALRRWHASAYVALTIFVIFRLYLAAGHEYDREVMRYMTYLMGPLFLFAALGFGQLAEWASQLGWQRPARRLGVLALVIGAYPVQTGWIDRNVTGTSNAAAYAEQVEVGVMIRTLEQYGECLTVFPTVRKEGPESWKIVTGGEIVGDGTSLGDALATHAATYGSLDDQCVMYFYGLDCQLLSPEQCGARVCESIPNISCPELGEPVIADRIATARYSYDDFGYLPTIVRVELRELSAQEVSRAVDAATAAPE